MDDFMKNLQEFSEKSNDAVKLDELKVKDFNDITETLPKEMIVESVNTNIAPIAPPTKKESFEDANDMRGFLEEYVEDKVQVSDRKVSNVTQESVAVTEKDVSDIVKAIIESVTNDRSLKNHIKAVVEEAVSEVVDEILDDYFEEDDLYEEEYSPRKRYR